MDLQVRILSTNIPVYLVNHSEQQANIKAFPVLGQFTLVQERIPYLQNTFATSSRYQGLMCFCKYLHINKKSIGEEIWNKDV